MNLKWITEEVSLNKRGNNRDFVLPAAYWRTGSLLQMITYFGNTIYANVSAFGTLNETV